MHSAVSPMLMQRWPAIKHAGFLGQTVLSNDPFALDKWRIQATHCFAGCVIKQYGRSVWYQVVLYRVPWHGTSTFKYEFARRRIKPLTIRLTSMRNFRTGRLSAKMSRT